MFKNLFALCTALHLAMVCCQYPGLLTDVYSSIARECPNHLQLPTFKVGRKCFYISDTDPMEWFTAKRYCRAIGLRLARILSHTEHYDIVQRIRNMGFQGQSFWLSGTDLGSEGQYYWSETYEPIQYTNWASGQPDDWTGEGSEGEDCLELWHERDFLWNTRHCAQKRKFICEEVSNDSTDIMMDERDNYPLQGDFASSDALRHPNYGYVQSSANIPKIQVGQRNFYFFTLAQTEWYSAQRYCLSTGLRLARILSKQEHERIVQHIRNMGLQRQSFWFSGTDLGTEGQYYWSETNEPVLFTNWASGQPDNWGGQGNEGEDCFELWHEHSFRWNTRHCTQKRFFICEDIPKPTRCTKQNRPRARYRD